MLCAFSMVRTVAVPLVAPGVTGTVASTTPSTTTWMLAMATVGLAGRDQVTGRLAGTALPLVGAVRVAAFGSGGTGPLADAVKDTAVAWVVLPAASLALTTRLCTVPAGSVGRGEGGGGGAPPPAALPAGGTGYTRAPGPGATGGGPD